MSEPVRIALVGATGLVGRTLLETAVGQPEVQVVAIARREMKLPSGGRMEMVLADPASWNEVLDVLRPTTLICALGTTWKQAGKDEAAFRAVDHDLVLATARAALNAGAERMVAVSSAGADPLSKNFYLKVKGEVERDLQALKFKRLDILRPGLLKGPRERDMRIGEGLARIASPLVDPFLNGPRRRYRSIEATTVAEAALQLSMRRAAGKFIHDNDGIIRAARDWANRTS